MNSIIMIDHSENNHYLTPFQYKKLADFQACQTIEKGGQIVSCPQCNTQIIYYNSCNQRGCPRCHKKNQLEWNKKLKRKLLKAGHFHLVITIPEEYIDTWLIDPANFINSFFYAVDKGFKKLQKDMGLVLGIVNVFQSHGVGLSYKPHMHCIVTKHGLDDQNQCVEIGSMKYSIISDTVKRELKKRLLSKVLSRQKEVFSFMLKDCKPKKYDVYPAIHKYNGDSIVDYLSKTTSGVATNIDLLERDKERDIMIVRDFHNGEERITELERSVFRDRYLRHIPPKRAVTIRNYGLYSNKNKQKLELMRQLLGEEIEPEEENEECCPECHYEMLEKQIFRPKDDYPLVLKLYLRKFEDPPKHGEKL